MSGPLSSIMGGGSVPVGGLIPLWGASDNPTINGAEYLRTGVLKAIAGYTALSTSNPLLTWNYGTLATNGAVAINRPKLVVTGNGNAYAFGLGSTQPSYSATLGGTYAATSGTFTDTAATEGFAWGSYITLLNGTTNIYTVLTGSGAPQVVTGTMFTGAANTAGNLAVCVAAANLQSAGQIYTCTTPGGAWTSQTGSTATTTIAFAAWCQPLGGFIYMDTVAKVYTTTNGYTLTDRGAVASMTVINTAYIGCAYHAENATVNLFSVRGSVSGGTQVPYLMRTTDGINFTATLWSSISNYFTNPPRIFHVNGVFIAISGSLNNAQDFYGAVMQSTDGITWTACPMFVNSASSTTDYPLAVAYYSGTYGVVTLNGVSTHTSLSATHVGVMLKSVKSTSGGSTITDYVRIK